MLLERQRLKVSEVDGDFDDVVSALDACQYFVGYSGRRYEDVVVHLLTTINSSDATTARSEICCDAECIVLVKLKKKSIFVTFFLWFFFLCLCLSSAAGCLDFGSKKK